MFLSQVTVLLQLTGDLLSIVGKGPSDATEAEQAINRQTALYSLKLLCRSFGSTHQEAFVPVLLQAVHIVTAAEEEKNVTGSALLCIAEVVSALKALAIPQLPRLERLNCGSMAEAAEQEMISLCVCILLLQVDAGGAAHANGQKGAPDQ